MENKANRNNTQAKVEKKPNQPLKPQEQGAIKQELKTDSKAEEPREYTINTNDIVINSKITTKDIRDSLWRCRDFELSHLWQRSIFLTTILILCFTGYGVVTMKLCEQIGKVVDSSVYVLNNIALVLCLVNTIFSVLWIMMAKASKAWYERYEEAIERFEQNQYYVNDDVIFSKLKVDGKEDKIECPIGGFQYHKLKGYTSPKTNDFLLSCKGGAYSPSRLNIAIGQISFFLWSITTCIHFYISINNFQLNEELIKVNIPLILFLVFWGIVSLLIIYSVYSKKVFWVKSKSLIKARKEINEGKTKKMENKKTAPK